MFSDPKLHSVGNNNYHVSYGDDSTTYAEFYMDAVIDEERTKAEGRPIYRNVEMVRIIVPGDMKTEKTGLATAGNPPYHLRFAKQYAAFKEQREQVQDGTPLEHWPPLDKATVMTLKAMKVHTVEQLAGLTDTHLNFMGARQLRDNAKAWLQEAEAGSAVMSLRNENESLRREIEALKNTLVGRGESASQKPKNVVEYNQEAAPAIEEATIQPIATKMRGRPRKVDNGADTIATDTAGGE